MGEGFSNELLWIWAWTTVLCAWIALRELPWPVAILTALARTSVPLLYFAVWIDGTWIMLDDMTYFAHGSELLQMGYGPLSAILTWDGIDTLCALCGSIHILYSWWNLVAQFLFGEYYYAPVFLNVALSFFASHLFSQMLKVMGFDAKYRMFAQVFLLAHWDVVAWTSFVNLKDMLVFTLTTAALYFYIAFYYQRRTRYLVAFGFVCFIFYWIRFYVPALIILAIVFWMLTQWEDRRKYLLGLLACGALLTFSRMLLASLDYLDPTKLFYGLIRFALTPMPWSISLEHSFLFWPSIFHWAMAIPTVVGASILWRHSISARLLLIYLAELVVFYAVTEELQGPRHRFQVTVVLIWAQFHVLWQLRPQPTSLATMTPVAKAAAPRLAA